MSVLIRSVYFELGLANVLVLCVYVGDLGMLLCGFVH